MWSLLSPNPVLVLCIVELHDNNMILEGENDLQTTNENKNLLNARRARRRCRRSLLEESKDIHVPSNNPNNGPSHDV